MSRFETKVPPVIWWAWGALVVLFVDATFGDALADAWGRVAGIIFLGGGTALALMAFSMFSKAQTTFDHNNFAGITTLLTDGVYKFSRNPMYLALMLLLIGWGLWRGSLVAAVLGALVFAALVTRFQIIPEERALAEQFKKKYPEYTAQTRRWL